MAAPSHSSWDLSASPSLLTPYRVCQMRLLRRGVYGYEDIIPAMTVHKSKGLEFHTVVFLGLEDSQLWNFARQSEEEIRGFFVAFSRAIHRVIFTFSDKRDGKYGRPERQSQRKIKDLYSLLQKAGVKTINCRDDSD
ncbi:3'-5' exonuclease [Gimesia sp.]|uniref:3'-5' exonuclease n=1 Tax=Gimesia sp. TaxID=2024833 RepID=UPI0025C245C9|nr:3'-5' exonuclease [Gimesia sp.]